MIAKNGTGEVKEGAQGFTYKAKKEGGRGDPLTFKLV